MKNARNLLKGRIGPAQLPLRYGGTRPDVTVRQPLQDTPPKSSPAAAASATTTAVVVTDNKSSAASEVDDDWSNGESVTTNTAVTTNITPTATTSIVPTTNTAATSAASASEEAEMARELEERVQHDPLDKEVLQKLDPYQAMEIAPPVEVRGGGFVTAPSNEARVEIEPKGQLSVELEVDMEKGSGVAVSWTFRLHTYLATMDIGFSVTFNPVGGEVQVVRAFSRVPEESPGRTGSWFTDKPGTLTFTWDNSYSMFISKDVEYKIKVWEEKEASSPRTRTLSFSKSESHLVRPLNNKSKSPSVDSGEGEDGDRSSFGFDMTLPDISLSEYLSFSSSPTKDEKKAETEEPSFWDRMSFGSSKKK